MFEPRVAFITPVYQRPQLTRACLEQRREMLARLPFEATAVVVGDDANLRVASKLGFRTIKKGNNGVGAKFNAGYYDAIRDWKATHVMPIGSDSWLHESAFEDADWQERGALGLVGLTSVAPWGDERIDLQIKYPAGFGVGMVYPAFAIQQGKGARPEAMKGIDSSTWSRCGRGRVQIEFLQHRPTTYTNFHSPDTQITDYQAVKSVHPHILHLNPWAGLRDLYGDENVEKVLACYAVASLGVMLTGKKPDWKKFSEKIERMQNRKLPGHKGRSPRRLDGSVRDAYRPKRDQPHKDGGVTYTEIVENFRALTE